jgi:hypothetical protein
MDRAGSRNDHILWRDLVRAVISLQRSNDFTLSLGSAILASGTIAYNSAIGQNRLTPYTFSSSGSLTVNAGDKLSLVIVRSAGQVTNSLDGVRLVITETTPSTVTSNDFIPTTPCRVVDTRNPAGPFGGPSVAGGSFRNFTIPLSACGIPNSATAYSPLVPSFRS